MKRIAAVLMAAIILLVFSAVPVYSSGTAFHYENAVDLKLLGLLEGSGGDFALERTSTRLEGAIMLVRLLGKEQYALQAKLPHPFMDVPAWAGNYVGYLYSSGITSGTSPDTFGSSQPLSPLQYSILVLRALGYSESQNDFTSENALDKAANIGLFSKADAEAFKGIASFPRDGVVMISYNALSTRMKGSSASLLDKLVTQDKAVSETTAGLLGLYTSKMAEYYGKNGMKTAGTGNGTVVKADSELSYILKNAAYGLKTQLKLDISSYSGDFYNELPKLITSSMDAASACEGVPDLLKAWQYKGTNTSCTLNITYRYTKASYETEKDNYRATIDKARHFAVGLSRKMSDFDKELQLHNYLVNNCVYDYEGYKAGSICSDSFKAYGCLILGKAVCQGYSEAMKLLCDLAGIECIVINGEAATDSRYISHSWNILKIAGNNYHLDVTFDDPVSDTGKNLLSYTYFNITDSEISKSHRWDTSLYPKCTSTQDNYYAKKNLIVGSKDELSSSIQKAAENRQVSMEFKAVGYKPPVYTDLRRIVSGSANASSFYYSVNEDFGIIKIYNVVYAGNN